ncbi:NADH-quinone oxidoreductase subunit NuoN [Ferruginivarius sediminum]|uniref:NADH-quinone oxidoreductase subunit N n=1 Tax=Ferruginivarius sediminum TaxID=2661937 RepID=A0A369TA32_9PROT|nr:NADH-quinone oxidoreductase subunit NuoN [Ferruginivarius sediminum]RDD62150.1 NADH-quinone oxidoreductase subunit NuoN [Ferruginivarius sediminum]
MTYDLATIIPELFLVVAATVLLMLGVFRGQQSTQLVLGLSVVAVVVTLALVWLAPAERAAAFGGLYVHDGFAGFMKGLILTAAALCLVMSWRYIERENMARFEFPVLMLYATVGMLMMVSANDLISLYVGLELQNLSLYVIAAFRRDAIRSTESGLKYFILSSLSSGLLLYGASMVYGFAGTTSFGDLAAIFAQAQAAGETPSVGLVVGVVFVIAGLAFKVSAVPFHMWTPDVYEGAPTAVTAFFSTAPKTAAIALFVRVMMGPFGDLTAQWQQVLVAISILSMVLGAFAAINQRNIKRMMAYSSIGHVGYALIGLASGTEAGIRGLAVYMAIYLFMNIGTFAVILCMRQKDRMVEQIDDLRGLSRTHPMMALAMGIFMFSMAGIPPLAGFFGKIYVFLAAVEAELYTLAVIGVLSSVVAAFYYLRIVKLMYFDEPAEAFDTPFGREMSLVMGATGLITLLFFVFPNPIVDGAEAAAAALLAG